jgi:preprotein translocase subunit SecA
MGVPFFGPLARLIFGTRNERMVKRYLAEVEKVKAMEPSIRALTDPELRAKTDEFRQRIAAGESAISLRPEVFAVAREAMDRNVGIRNVLDPALAFDATELPEDARQILEDLRRRVAEEPDREPTGDLRGCRAPVPAWRTIEIPIRLYEAVRELLPESRPPFRARPFDVQIVGGIVLSEGRIAEMKTGEGKTIVAPLAAYLAALEGLKVHVVTVNDYLVQRDRDWTFPFFQGLGLTVGAIHPFHMQAPEQKAIAYSCDVLYGTTAEFGFDYLRDNMKMRAEEQFQKRHDFAIVDEVDSILIDEARTPLIISGPAHPHQPRYDLADRLARHLVERQREWNAADEAVQACKVAAASLEGEIRSSRDRAAVPQLKERLDAKRRELPGLELARDRFTRYYEVELDKKRATLTHEGVEEAQRSAGIGSFYVGDNIDMPHLLEQAIRAHTVYERDRDYVVASDDRGELGVVIVDQNTGRKMVGRQWSDGLHQAVEAKEGVRIKEETQTMATITVQNYFKMHQRLAGMTGTADTEATEFHEIYKLDVISIPTNEPIARADRNDLVFLSLKDKWSAIVDEIKACHDFGQPVLVGTTSVEKSEKLSEMLSRRHQIRHEVLNAKQHEREAEIVAGAGRLGAVMIATNMAGRGTDIKLRGFDRAELVEHWKRRDLCPKEAQPGMEDAEILDKVHRHLLAKESGRPRGEIAGLSAEEARRELLRHLLRSHHEIPLEQTAKLSEEELAAKLDAGGLCRLHRLQLCEHVEALGGLNIVGTERHESRRIDNQLRGRSGRQGDPGSSRFFLSLEDDLMKLFAGPKTLSLLSRLGMKEGDAIENAMVSRQIERAQRKVEERNFQIRKNILEYDEPMEHQRRKFYALRQRILEGREIRPLIFEQVEAAVADAADRFMAEEYPVRCMAEWLREHHDLVVDAERLVGKERDEIPLRIRDDAFAEIAGLVKMTAGEYLPIEMEASEWDWSGFASWARQHLKIEVQGEALEPLGRSAAIARIESLVQARLASLDVAPALAFLEPGVGARDLLGWASRKLGHDLPSELLEGVETPEAAIDRLMERLEHAYAERERAYPIDFALEMTGAMMPRDPAAALTQFCSWVKARYELEWSPAALPSSEPAKLREILLEEAGRWDDARIERRTEKALASGGPDEIAEWFEKQCQVRLEERERESLRSDARSFVPQRLRDLLRTELAQFERWVLLRIVDDAWKDHLHQMDQLRDSIGFRAFSQRDPRIEFKREAAKLFEQMQEGLGEKVTDIIFKGRIAIQAPAPQPTARMTTSSDAEAAPAPAAPAPRTAAVPPPPASRIAPSAPAPQRPAAAAVATAVGRNEPCPCGSGKKYKQCHGKAG